LSEPKAALAAASIGNKVLFAGGGDSNGFFNSVDIYDIDKKTWSKLQLSQPRAFLSSSAAGNAVLFAGGTNGSNTFNTVDKFLLLP
jgi:N-acetylneuraminic acid mutarotase